MKTITKITIVLIIIIIIIIIQVIIIAINNILVRKCKTENREMQ